MRRDDGPRYVTHKRQTRYGFAHRLDFPFSVSVNMQDDQA